MKYFFVALIVIFLVVACAKKQTVQGEGSTGETIFEEVSPEEVDTSSIVFEEIPVAPPSGSFVEEPVEETPVVTSTPSVTRRGYRVQIGAYDSQAEANAAADRARSLLTRSVYIQYIAPHYKVRVGDFTSKYEAAQYRDQVRRISSYRDAWVTESEIIIE